MATVYGGDAVVNPEPATLGDTVCDLYDWLISKRRPGRTRHVEVTPPASPYEQVARQLRELIFDGEYPPGSKIPSAYVAGRYPVSQPSFYRACVVLRDEGLVKVEPGRRGTTVLERERWRVQAEAAPGPDAITGALEAARKRLESLSHRAASEPAITREEAALVFTVVIESNHVDGALAVGMELAHHVLGELPVRHVDARPA